MQIETNKLISITDVAIEKFKEMLFDFGFPEGFLKVSLELDGTGMFYRVNFFEEVLDDHKLYEYNGLKVIVAEEDVDLLNGLIIDYVEDEFGSDFTLDNPNLSELDFGDEGGCGCGCGHCH